MRIPTSPLFPNPVLYALLAVSILTNVIVLGRHTSIDWHRFVHREQAVPAPDATDHVRGRADAPVTVVTYSDFQCPYSARFHQVLKTTMQSAPDVRWVYRHLPLADLHPLAVSAAEAAECAADQGQFWRYADRLFEEQKRLDETRFAVIARELNLDEGRFAKCRQGGSKRARVSSDVAQFSEGHLAGTPVSFINGARLEGAVSLEEMQRAISAAR